MREEQQYDRKGASDLVPSVVRDHSDRFMISQEKQDSCTGHRDASCDAMLPGPCAVLILQFDQFRLHLGVPLVPVGATDAMQAVADVQVREELLTADGSEAGNKLPIIEILRDGHRDPLFPPTRRTR